MLTYREMGIKLFSRMRKVKNPVAPVAAALMFFPWNRYHVLCSCEAWQREEMSPKIERSARFSKNHQPGPSRSNMGDQKESLRHREDSKSDRRAKAEDKLQHKEQQNHLICLLFHNAALVRSLAGRREKDMNKNILVKSSTKSKSLKGAQ